jgi:hypothetical protein
MIFTGGIFSTPSGFSALPGFFCLIDPEKNNIVDGGDLLSVTTDDALSINFSNISIIPPKYDAPFMLSETRGTTRPRLRNSNSQNAEKFKFLNDGTPFGVYTIAKYDYISTVSQQHHFFNTRNFGGSVAEQGSMFGIRPNAQASFGLSIQTYNAAGTLVVNRLASGIAKYGEVVTLGVVNQGVSVSNNLKLFEGGAQLSQFTNHTWATDDAPIFLFFGSASGNGINLDAYLNKTVIFNFDGFTPSEILDINTEIFALLNQQAGEIE